MNRKLNCVLVIDDDEPTSFISQMIVEKSGCADYIKIAQGGQEALDYLTNCIRTEKGDCFPCPDLIFLDINMPAMNGWEFLVKYKKLEKEYKGRIVMVMLTNSPSPEDMIKANELPEISGFENKPLTSEKLNRILARHFSQ